MPLQLPICLCQNNLTRQNHKITNITREKKRKRFTLYISIITYGINNKVIYSRRFSLKIGSDFCDFCDEVSQRDRREHCKSAKNTHFIAKFDPSPKSLKPCLIENLMKNPGIFFVLCLLFRKFAA